MKQIFILSLGIASIITCNSIIAQTPVISECHQHAEPINNMMQANGAYYCSYNDIWSIETSNDPYIPSPNSPVYTVRLNFHLMQEDDGSGNFQDNATDRAFLMQLTDAVNTIYSANHQPIWNGLRNDHINSDNLEHWTQIINRYGTD
ncbi:MAG: hypothetical protein ACYC2P_05145 [Paludibacteraceae bacterium]